MMMGKIFGALLLSSTFFVSDVIAAVPEETQSAQYYQYISDVLLAESRLLLAPNQPLRYSQSASETANLLKSVLDPKRIGPVAEMFNKGLPAPNVPINLPIVLQPLITIYGKAFKTFGNRYENAYLDTLQITVILMRRSDQPAQGSAENVPDDVKRLQQSLQSLDQSVRSALGKQFLDLAASGKLTPQGQERARAMAAEFLPQGSTLNSPPLTP